MKIRAIIIEGEVDEATIAAIHAAVAPEATRLTYAPSVAEIVAAVARETDIPASDIVGPYQAAPIVRARQAVSWIARRVCDRSLSSIGAALRRDHSTIIQHLGRADRRREQDDDFRDLTDRLVAAYTVGLAS